MVVTSHGRIDAERRTGLWLEEFAVPYDEFRSAGLEVAVASPLGGAAPIDPHSAASPELASAWVEADARLRETLPLDAVAHPEAYDAIFLPGGHGTMFDLPDNVRLRQLLQEFEAQGKIIAAVCHGPAGFVNVLRRDDRPLVEGRVITAFTDAEEREVGLAEKMPFLLESTLRREGARFIDRPNWADHTEVDGNLVTGQNPQSSRSCARAVLQLLAERTGRAAA